MKYTNPILSGFYPDPSICKAGDKYYLVTSSFEYFPGIPLFESNDLVNWEQIGHVLTREKQLNLKRQRPYPVSQGIYAPTIRYHNGKFYVITTNMTTMETFYVWTNNPKGEWSDPIVIKNFLGFDPSLFFDEDGNVYLTAGALPLPNVSKEGIIQARIDIDTGKLLEEPQSIWEGSGYSNPEGPHLYKKNGWYYLMVAEGGTEFGHAESIARSAEPFGPFENNPDNPIVSNRSTNLSIQATGHADLIETKEGDWFAVLLGIRPLNGLKVHHLGRETSLVPVEWTEEGWPIFGNNKRVESKYEINAEGEQKILYSWVDDFYEDNLHSRWNTLRNLDTKVWELNNGLKLIGKNSTLNDTDDAPAFIGCRQKDKECEITVELDFDPKDPNEEAGLTVFMNENFHYDIYITNNEVVLRKQVGDISYIEKKVNITGTIVTFKVKALEDKYEFYIQGNDELEYIGSGETRLLAKEIAGGFTGIYFGMYATGNGQVSETNAVFKRFEYSIGN